MCNSDFKSILKEFTKPDNCTRFLISSIALRIGINIPEIGFMIHWGAPKTLEDYWQEVGRAGCDGKAAQAKMYATKYPCSTVHRKSKHWSRVRDATGFVVGDSDIQGTLKSVW
ncbi:hypothetical protein DPMN_081076 [Dreissena polymorpha]|uniref:DNA 3'-5' helicase n=1 Tax=Dreissena polymorpha TaxID=45954 RepID=A0A9D4BFY8_DREPO|nr:hypothetical protein DPMN_081076 [Dreissena polymorpha]